MHVALCSFIALISSSLNICYADTEKGANYSEAVELIAAERTELAKRWHANADSNLEDIARTELISSIETLTRHWIGTRWALGAPQTTTPQQGKVNCGTFVGRILHDAGFEVNVKKLQRQPSQLIIKSFVGGKRVRKFSNATMKRFLASVREMGPGLFIIGLDFHVGLLLQTDDDLRFIHASFETETVVNEDAATAMPITTSRYKVVGKILSPANVRSWLRGDTIVVKGRW